MDLLVWAATEAPTDSEGVSTAPAIPWTSVAGFVVSLLAIVVASIAAFTGVRSSREARRSREVSEKAFKSSEDQRRSAERLREISQASLVWAWVRYEKRVNPDDPLKLVYVERVLQVMNGSREPIYDVLVSDPDWDQPYRVGLVTPSDHPITVDSRPRESARVLMGTEAPVVVRFRDAAGLGWERNEYDIVRRVK